MSIMRLLTVLVVFVGIIYAIMLSRVDSNRIDPGVESGRCFAVNNSVCDNADTKVYPFQLSVDTARVERMKVRLENTVFEDAPILGADWEYGVPLSAAQEVVTYFASRFNWTEKQAHINACFENQQFKTTIAGLSLHYVHIKSEQSGNPVLVLIHGWPGSFLEFERIIPLLTPHYELVIPSLPGFGPSEASHQAGFGAKEAAATIVELLQRLEISHYFVQAGDWGAYVARGVALLAPERVLGVHLNFFPGLPPLPAGPLQLGLVHVHPSLSVFEPEEVEAAQNFLSSLVDQLTHFGYLVQSGTKPDTLALALHDPASWTVWVYDRFYAWSQPTSMSDLHERFGGLDNILTDIALYYLTGSITSGVRFYYENQACVFAWQSPLANQPLHVPVGLSDFPQDVYKNLPVAWAKRLFPDMITYTRHDYGGHFAAMERPNALAEDIIAFTSQVQQRDYNMREFGSYPTRLPIVTSIP